MNKAKLIKECDRQIERSYDDVKEWMDSAPETVENMGFCVAMRNYCDLDDLFAQTAIQLAANACMGNTLDEFYKYEILKMNANMRAAENILDQMLTELAEKLKVNREEIDDILYPNVDIKEQMPDEELLKALSELDPYVEKFTSLTEDACDFCKERML